MHVFGTLSSRAFIDFATVEQAKAAVEALEGKLIDFGEVIAQVDRANFTRPRKNGARVFTTPSSILYIADIPNAHALDELEPLFSEREGFQKLFTRASLEVFSLLNY